MANRKQHQRLYAHEVCRDRRFHLSAGSDDLRPAASLLPLRSDLMLWRYRSRILPFLVFFVFPVLLQAQEEVVVGDESVAFQTNYHMIFMIAAISCASSVLLALATYLIDKNANRHDRTN